MKRHRKLVETQEQYVDEGHYAIEEEFSNRYLNSVRYASWYAAWSVAQDTLNKKQSCEEANLLRDLVGNPFRSIVIENLTDLLTPNILSLTNAAYNNHEGNNGHLNHTRLCILADALEETGCPSVHPIVVHLRSSTPHFRGCWSLDLLLRKK